MYSSEASQPDASTGTSSEAGKSVPSLPDKIVGDQRDPRAGPNNDGGKHTSGNLLPENGGKNDYKTDLGTLAGETRESAKGDKAPPGSQIGQNGVFGRDPNSKGGKSIDIPANGTWQVEIPTDYKPVGDLKYSNDIREELGKK